MIAADPTDLAFLALAIPAVIMAGISKGGFGAGAAFAATPLLALAMDPRAAVGLMLPLLMVMDVTGLRAYWRRWSWPEARALMIGCVPGVALGAVLFSVTPVDAVRLMIGLVALGFLAHRIASQRGWIPLRRLSERAGMLWGAAAGFTSYASHAGGPPAAVFLLGRQMEKTAYQATTVVVFWWINLVKLGPYAATGIIDRQTAVAALWLAPVAVAGMLLGVALHGRFPERLYFRVILVLLGATGIKLVWDGATGLLG